MIYWLILGITIVFEVAGTVSMKFTHGFTKFLSSALLFIFYGASFVAMTFALKKIDIVLAYAIWSGLGTALITIIGIFFFKETVSAVKLVSIMLVIVGVIGLKMGGVEN